MGGPLVFLVALLALFRAVSKSSFRAGQIRESGTPSSTAMAAAASSADSQEGAITPLLEFLRLSHGHTDDPGSVGIDQLFSPGDHLEVLIATVPDPSGLGSLRSSIWRSRPSGGPSRRNAMSSIGTGFPGPSRKVPRPRPRLVRGEMRHGAAVDRKPGAGKPITSRQPGSILFRRTQETNKRQELAGAKPSGLDLLLLLLVAESPTTGIDKDQFWNALDITARLATHRKIPQRAWCVLGPASPDRPMKWPAPWPDGTSAGSQTWSRLAAGHLGLQRFGDEP